MSSGEMFFFLFSQFFVVLKGFLRVFSVFCCFLGFSRGFLMGFLFFFGGGGVFAKTLEAFIVFLLFFVFNQN